MSLVRPASRHRSWPSASLHRARLPCAIIIAGLAAACAGDLDAPERFAKPSQTLGAASFTQRPAAGAGGTSAASGGNGGATAPGSTCPDMAVVLQANCATEGCHVAPGPQSKIDFTAEGLAERLRGKTGSDGTLLVDPAAPTQSLVYEKLLANPAVGIRMPILAPPFEPAALACVTEWIGQIAPK